MIRNLLKKLTFFFWLAPGFLLWASFPPMGECKDAYLALAPLLWLVRQGDVKKSVVRWFLNGFLFWFATLSWMPAIVKNGGPWPLVVLGWGVLAVYCAGYFAAFGWLSARLWCWVRNRGYWWRLMAIVVAEPLLWAGLEIVRSRLLGGFAWNQLGVVAANAGFGAPARFGGVYLLSAAIVLINGTIASIAETMLAPWLGARGGKAAAIGAAASPVEIPRMLRSLETVLPLLFVVGLYCLPGSVPASAPENSRTLTVALFQRNFPCVFDRHRREDPIAVYSNLASRVAFLKPDLAVLPESALCEIGDIGGRDGNDLAFARWLAGVARSRAVLAGGGRGEGGRIYNSAALYAGSTVALYDKVHLVPFGEFIPGDKLFPALQKLAPVGSCSAGELKLMELPAGVGEAEGVGLGVAICYEDTDSAQIRRLAAMGAKMLVFITNDSWFSHSSQTVQHAWQATARAIETGLPVVRVGNSGVTGVIFPDGRAEWLRDEAGGMLVDVSGTMCERVGVSRGEVPPTFYVRWGDAPLFTAFLLLIVAMSVVKYLHEHEKRRYLP